VGRLEMKSNGHLRGFSEAVEKTNRDLYVTGTIYPGSVILSEETEGESPTPEIVYNKEWNYPKRVTGIPGTELAPYKPWNKSIRRTSKERIFSKLNLIPEEYQLYKETNPESFNMPQLPLYFMDGVPSFEEIPFGFGNFFHQDLGQGPDTGSWGNLISSLTQAGTSFLESIKQKYLAQATSPATSVPTSSLIAGTSSNFLMYAVIGSGLLYFLFMKKKPASSGRVRRRYSV
jgi:hypothetical protein